MAERADCSIPDSPAGLFDHCGGLLASRPVAYLGLSAGDVLPGAVRAYLDSARVPFRILAVSSSGYVTFFGCSGVAVGEAAILCELARIYGPEPDLPAFEANSS